MSPADAFVAWKERAAHAPIGDVARALGAKLKKVTAVEYAGPCPRCGGDDRFAINLHKGVFNCRGSGEGGDVIGMVKHIRGVDFLAACEIINGEPPPDRGSQLEEADRERLEREAAERAERERKKAADDNVFRERERGTLYDIWHRAERDADELVRYLEIRLGPHLGPILAAVPRSEWPRLRLVRDMPYYRQGADRGDILAHALAIAAPLVGTPGKFRGLHFTYLDLAQPNGKLRISDPDKPGELLPAKKVRGSKQGHWIDLFPIERPTQLFLGEGSEKTLAVWLLRLAGRDLSATAFWVASDLGNLGGKSAASVRHPTLRHEKSRRPVVVAGPDPDLAAPAIVIPDTVDDLVLIGDSTSDRFTTHCALARASKRYARAGRAVRIAWQPEGLDFDDVLREAA